MKTYDANRGIRLDATFIDHVRDCEHCARFDAKKPATAGLMCLEGSVLYKRDSAVAKPRQHVERSEFCATKGRIKSAIRYKGE